MVDAAVDATEKAYCNEQIANTEAKKSDLEAAIGNLTTKNESVAASANLEEVDKELQSVLAALVKE